MDGVTRARAAVLAAVLLHPSTRLHCELRMLPVDEVWERFCSRDAGLPETLLTRFDTVDIDALLRRTQHVGARIVIPGDDEWPPQLADLGATTPWALWLRGKLLERRRSVALVGSRSCTPYGERIAAEFAADIANEGYPIVSGGAFGIDAAAHRGALTTPTPTIAVLACGVDVPYPAAHAALFERIVSQGTIVSESPPGAHPTRAAFLIRNRVIAAIAYGTVVVEARFRSGALSTYRHAAELNRILMGVPGPVTSPESGGVHELLKTDAQLVTSGDDVLALIAPVGEVAGEVHPDLEHEWDALNAHERLVHDAFPGKASTTIGGLRDRMTHHLSIPEVLAALTALAQRGLVGESLDGSWRRLRNLRGAAR
jgi:DNA processing protein